MILHQHDCRMPSEQLRLTQIFWEKRKRIVTGELLGFVTEKCVSWINCDQIFRVQVKRWTRGNLGRYRCFCVTDAMRLQQKRWFLGNYNKNKILCFIIVYKLWIYNILISHMRWDTIHTVLKMIPTARQCLRRPESYYVRNGTCELICTEMCCRMRGLIYCGHTAGFPVMQSWKSLYRETRMRSIWMGGQRSVGVYGRV